MSKLAEYSIVARAEMLGKTTLWREFCFEHNYATHEARPGLVGKFASWIEERDRFHKVYRANVCRRGRVA